MNYDKKPKIVKLNFEFDEKNLSIEDRIIIDHLSLKTLKSKRQRIKRKIYILFAYT